MQIIGAKANAPEAANNLLKVLRLLFNYAVKIEMIPSNPAIGIERYPTQNPDGIHTWTENEAKQFLARHSLGSKAHLAMQLMLCLGQRRSDAVRMGWQHIRADKITIRQEKTNTLLVIPIHPDLEQALAATSRTNLTFLVTKHGKPFSVAGFGNWFRERGYEAGLPQCSSHGLRKLAATRLAQAGCSEREIMAVTGHKSVSEVSRYTKAVDESRFAEQATVKLTTARTNRDEKLSSTSNPLDKTASK